MMFVFPAMRIKVGQTAYLWKRRADISESLPGQLVIPICIIFAVNYIEIEKHLHRVFSFCRYDFKGSGYSEYFTTLYAPLIFLYMVIIQALKLIEFFTYIAAFIFALWVVFQMITK
jgi:hypothetical protein